MKAAAGLVRCSVKIAPMSQLNEIKRKIGSVSKTRAITEAMQRIASVKVGYARRRAEAVRPYTQALLGILRRLVTVRPEYAPALMRSKGSGGVGLFVVTTDKGLCGALNVRLLQLCVRKMQSWQEAGQQVYVTAVGNRGLGVLRGAGANIVAEAASVSGDVLESEELLGAVAVALQQFIDGEIDQLWVATNRFVNALAYEPVLERLLPVEADLLEHISISAPAPAANPADSVDYLYEPDPEHSINLLLMRYVESMMYRAVADNVACEHSARMMAMKAASDNATRLIDLLTHSYHKTRQEAITRELIELTAGADALAER